MRRIGKTKPTFALLQEKHRLRVLNPENGARFTISLKGWQEMLWAVRVFPEACFEQPHNAYTTAHRIVRREVIEDWLAELHLDCSDLDNSVAPRGSRSGTKRSGEWKGLLGDDKSRSARSKASR